MNSWLFAVVYYLFPCLIAAFAITLYVRQRPLRPEAAWLLASCLAVLFAGVAVWAMHSALGNVVPVIALVKAYGSLYGIPLIVLTSASLALRTRLGSRWRGVAALVALFLVSAAVSWYVSEFYFALVNASG
jgi:hypothetical protein